MSRQITSKDSNLVRERYTIGVLQPVEESYYKWADKDNNKNKIPGTGGEVAYDEWLKLPENRKGRKWAVSIDTMGFNPNAIEGKPYGRSYMVGFPDFDRFFVASVNDVIGLGDKSVDVFLDRAASKEWFVEARMDANGTYVDKDGNEKPQTSFYFTRMTQDVNEAQAWSEERFPKQELVVPEELVTRAKLIWEKLAKGNPDIFTTLVNEDEDLSPYLLSIVANDFALVK